MTEGKIILNIPTFDHLGLESGSKVTSHHTKYFLLIFLIK